MISFVIPAYNEADYITAAIIAIRAELDRNDIPGEIIVVDNGSTDATVEIANNLQGVTVLHESVRGVAAARSAGYRVAQYPLVANVDADTHIGRGWISRVIEEFDADPNLVALSGPYHYYDITPRQRALVTGYYYVAYMTYLMTRAMLQGGNAAIRRSALQHIIDDYSKFTFYGEDTALARALAQHGRVKFDLSFRAASSGRRLAAEGLTHVGLSYTVNYFWSLFFNKPLTKSWADHR